MHKTKEVHTSPSVFIITNGNVHHTTLAWLAIESLKEAGINMELFKFHSICTVTVQLLSQNTPLGKDFRHGALAHSTLFYEILLWRSESF